MFKTILLYGILLGVLVSFLHAIEYFFWVRVHAFEIYGGLISILFLGIGLWIGHARKVPKNQESITKVVYENYGQLGISKREYEVLLLLGQGLSNQEIAQQLFVSTNTIKTHLSRLFEKLEVKNRTQAIIKAQEVGLITG